MGKSAAEYIKNQDFKSSDKYSPINIPVTPGNRVRYTVPQHLELEPSLFENAGSEKDKKTDSKIRIMFRSTDVYRSVLVSVYAGTKLLSQQKKRIVRPGELQTIDVKTSSFKELYSSPQPVTVSIELPEDAID